ncbi:Mur ligase family protein, partial [Enterobacter roggenkampii]|uniref:Mur ligase family protein n=1 Tax=Enterobacter roggenkampii TaxID=1812935 RepID=UPI0023B7F2F1
AVFTNFTQDHLDYHGSMDAYWAAKRALFGFPGLRAAVVNLDDPRGAGLAAELSGLDLWTTGIDRADARLNARGLHYTGEGLAFTLHEG